MCFESLVFNELNFEQQSGICRNNPTNRLVSIGIFRRTSYDSLLSNTHFGDSEIPSFNYLASTQSEYKRLVSVNWGVELSAVGESSSVVNCDFASLFGLVTVSFQDGFDSKLHLIYLWKFKLRIHYLILLINNLVFRKIIGFWRIFLALLNSHD